MSREDYLNLGVRQSIFLDKERPIVYDIFEKYLDYLKEGKYYDSNIVAFEHLEKVTPRYDFLVVDEVQDFTNVQLKLMLQSLKNQATNFILSGDSNQIVHPNFFSWSQLKSMFFQSSLKGTLIRILKTNYRNSQKITTLSNNLLKIKNARFGSIDKESTYLIDTVSETKGEINFYQESDTIQKELNTKTQGSTKFAVLVMNNEEKSTVSKHFNTPLLFSIQEAKGLEYENIILFNFISNYDKEFRHITDGVTDKDLLDENMQFGRAKDKTNKEAAKNGSIRTLNFALEQEIDKTKVNKEGLTALQLVIHSYDREKLKYNDLQKIYPQLMTPYLKVQTEDKIIKVNKTSMEYFLVNYMKAVIDDIVDVNDPPSMRGMKMDDFMILIEDMPDIILPEYRRKRQYVNSILAKNEVDRNDPYNRLLFKRVSRGCYNFNPKIKILYK